MKLFVIWALLVIHGHGIKAYLELGLFQQKVLRQTIAHSGWELVTDWRKKSAKGTYKSSILLENRDSTIVIPETGNYLVTSTLHLEHQDNAIRWIGIRNVVTQEFYEQSGKATSEKQSSITLSSLLQFNVNQKIGIFTKSEHSFDVLVGSSIVLTRISSIELAPSFSAKLSSHARLDQNETTNIYLWETRSPGRFIKTSSFSPSTGQFEARINSCYLVNAVVSLESISAGIQTVDILVNNQTIHSTKLPLVQWTSFEQIVVSRTVSLEAFDQLSLRVMSTSIRALVSPTSSFSVTIIAKGKAKGQQESDPDYLPCLEVESKHDTVVMLKSETWNKLENLTDTSMILDRRPDLEYYGGDLLIKESGYFQFTMSVAVVADTDTLLHMAVIVEGSPNALDQSNGLYTSGMAYRDMPINLHISGVFQLTSKQYISVYVMSKGNPELKILSGSSSTSLAINYSPPSYILRSANGIQSSDESQWVTISLRRVYEPSRLSQGTVYNGKIVDSYQNRIDHDGIYVVGFGLKVTNSSREAVEGRVIVVRGTEQKRILTVFNTFRDNINTISAMIATQLLMGDQVRLQYRCHGNPYCYCDEDSTLSIGYIDDGESVIGFSSYIRSKETNKLSTLQLNNYYENILLGNKLKFGDQWNATSGVYNVVSTGVYYIMCNIILKEVIMPKPNSRVLLEINDLKETQAYRLAFVQQTRGNQKRGFITLGLSLPLNLNAGSKVSLGLQTKFVSSYVIDGNSSLSIVYLPYQVSSETRSDFKFTGILESKQSSTAPTVDNRWTVITDWAQSSMTGSFLRQLINGSPVFTFSSLTGVIKANEMVTALISVTAVVKRLDSQRIDATLILNDQPLNKLFYATDGEYNRDIVDVKSTLTFSGVLVLCAGDVLEIAIRGSKFYVYSNTYFSLVILGSVQPQPRLGLVLPPQQMMLSAGSSIPFIKFAAESQRLHYSSERLYVWEADGKVHVKKYGYYLISTTITCDLITKIENTVTLDLIMLRNKKDEIEISQLKYNKIINASSSSNVQLQLLEADDVLDFQLRRDSISNINIDISFTMEMRLQNGSEEVTSIRILPTRIYKRQAPTNDSSGIAKLTNSGTASYTAKKPGLYLMKLLHQSEKDVESGEVNFTASVNGSIIFATSSSTPSYNLPRIMTIVELKYGDKFSLKKMSDKDKNTLTHTITFQKINDRKLHSDDHLSAVIENDIDICVDEGWTMIKPWLLQTVPYDWRSIDYALKGTFVINMPGSYVISSTIMVENLNAITTVKRQIAIVVDGWIEKATILNTSVSANEKETFSFMNIIQLEEWQSVSVYVNCMTNDSVLISKYSHFTLTRIEASPISLANTGPRITQHPTPAYSNSPEGGTWTCEAVGEAPISYLWYRLGQDFEEKKYVALGRQMKFEGLPEETGDYVCLALSKKTSAASNAARIDISDVDECNATASNITVECHEHAACVNTIGSFYCQCIYGYEGDGYICEDVNECDVYDSPCHSNATCINEEGGFDCKCKHGFTGTGFTCEDINECDDPKLAKCDSKSTCLNTLGSYQCKCLPGYHGNGFTCKDIDECNLLNVPCDENARCYNLIGSYECKCDIGWEGNGTHCEDINECDFDDVNCHGNATCFNSPGSYRCKCDRGFNGDGFSSCKALGCMPPPYCSGEFRASWWPRTPYLTNTSTGKPEGLFKDLLNQMVSSCCNNCSLVVFDPPTNGSLQLGNLITSNETDFSCPVYGSREQNYFSGYPYASIVESPGVAFFIKDKPSKNSPLIDSLSGSWPILLITFLLAILSGVIMWFLDTMKNPDQFPHSFLEGSWEGFWWAFISMTTVGYGDKAPKSLLGRFFGIIWILIGLVIISTFTATITTMLTASSLANEVRLYGTKVGVLDNSEEYRLAVKRNADVFSYHSVPDILKGLADNEIEGALLDTYVAGEFQDELSQYRLHQIVEHVFTYGVVLTRDGMALKSCFKNFLETRQSEVYLIISKAVKPLKEKRKQSFAMDKSSTLFDAKSDFFKYAVFGGLGLLALIFLLGMCWEKFCMKRIHGEKNGYAIAYLDDKELEKLGWNSKEQWHKNPLSSEIVDIKTQIQSFSLSWIERLEKLERRHKLEMENASRFTNDRFPLSPYNHDKRNTNGYLTSGKNHDATVV